MKNIILIGMPGCGKSTLGKLLAQQLQRPFYDADSVLEEREGRSIKELFAVSEECFRDAETRTVKYLSGLDGCVIAAGGGVVKRAENIEIFKTSGMIVFLDRLPEKIVQDVDTASRPLLAAGRQRIFDLYAERIELYRRYHDHSVDNNGEREAALQALLELVRRES
ncbi:shikimate kinase [uncultured Phascolarctobacterium sp.]|jgi:shikimate kinase|uniref:shikimate kinase n=1 Tax=uncultured Phascolarctobacterium sp. TaxID=512296 RepID=UPI0015A8D5A5|nr:shikimate kinase [uncultured Phascolarctobacterium sp.]MDO5379907.1 shikimate kinase [Acidaminococcaceae bacterium]